VRVGTAPPDLAETGEMAILQVEQYADFAASLVNPYLLMKRGEIIMHGRGEPDAGRAGKGRPVGVNRSIRRSRCT